jgi:hypothetical protein
LTGCAGLRSAEKYSRIFDSSLEKVTTHLEDALEREKLSFTTKKEADGVLYEAKTGACLDTTTTLWIKSGTKLKIEVIRVRADKTKMVITAKSTIPLLRSDSYKATRDIIDAIRVRIAEETEIAEVKVAAKPTAGQEELVPVIPISDVDKEIPVTNTKNPDSIAVVIGNRDYKNKDVPSVDYALNDAEAMKKYLINVLGYRAGNIVHEQNASKATFQSVFGTKEDYKGKLYRYLRKGESDIFIYYSGHGAPDTQNKRGYFVPVDADPEAIQLTGYALDQLYENIAKVARDKESPNVYIIIEACFSGSTEKGFLLKNMSPVSIQVENPVLAMPNAVVLTSSMGSEVSSWYPEKGHSMFTYFFLKALKEAAGKGQTATAEGVFKSITDETDGLPYYVRRLHGRIQTPQIMGDKNRAIFEK